jgi:hypothetical protein
MGCTFCDGGPFYTKQAKWRHDCPSEITVPTEGTKTRVLMNGLLRAHEEGIEWPMAADVHEHLSDDGMETLTAVSGTYRRTITKDVRVLSRRYDYVTHRVSEWHDHRNEYRIDEDERERLRTILD